MIAYLALGVAVLALAVALGTARRLVRLTRPEEPAPTYTQEPPNLEVILRGEQERFRGFVRPGYRPGPR